MYASEHEWPAPVTGRRTILGKYEDMRVKWEFDNLSDFADQANVRASWSNWGFASRSEGNAGWYHTASMDEAQRFVRGGWDKGLEQVHKAVTAIELVSNTPEPRPHPEMDVGGYYPVVPLYVAGDPHHMVAQTSEQKVCRAQVDILVNTAVTCNVSTKQVSNFGAALLANVDRLENAGVRVGITFGLTYRNGGKGLDIMVRMKRPEQSLPLPVMAFALLNASMHRRLGFSVMEQIYFPEWKGHFEFGYGSPVNKFLEEPKDVWRIARLEDWGKWDESKAALDHMARKFEELAKQHNQERVAEIMAA
jgi:hypothetical protein